MKQFGKTGICVRWFARIVSGLVVLMFLLFAFGEGLPTLSTLSTVEKAMFIGLAVALTGILVAWRWSLAGCLLIMAGYVGFVIADGHFTILNPFLLFPVIVMLYVLAWVFDRQLVQQRNKVGQK